MRANYLYAGSVDDVMRGIGALVDPANPEWFAWLFDQGLLPQAELREQHEILGIYALPCYR